jgi:tetratricopeptide (TPR) repeat protein
MYQGVLLMTIGNFEEAKKMFQKALEIDPINKKAQEYLDRINKGAV